MGLTDAFNRQRAAFATWKHYRVLVQAIKAKDYAAIEDALQNDYVVNYRTVDPLKRPLSVALRTGDEKIFNLLLQYGAEIKDEFYNYYEHRRFGSYYLEPQQYLHVSYLAAALELGHEKIATLLSCHPDVNPAIAGFITGSNSFKIEDILWSEPLAKLAREKGFEETAQIIEQRVTFQNAKLALREANNLQNQADTFRHKAHVLSLQAERMKSDAHLVLESHSPAPPGA